MKEFLTRVEARGSIDKRRGLQSLEMLAECLIDDLGNRQVVEVCVAPDRLDPAAFDMEGRSLHAF